MEANHLAGIQYIDQLAQQIDVHCYVPPNPATTFYLARSKDLRSVKIDVEHIVLALQYQPYIGSRGEVVLSNRQFNEIQRICDEV
jgi:hypothetical protein